MSRPNRRGPITLLAPKLITKRTPKMPQEAALISRDQSRPTIATIAPLTRPIRFKHAHYFSRQICETRQAIVIIATVLTHLVCQVRAGDLGPTNTRQRHKQPRLPIYSSSVPPTKCLFFLGLCCGPPYPWIDHHTHNVQP